MIVAWNEEIDGAPHLRLRRLDRRLRRLTEPFEPPQFGNRAVSGAAALGADPAGNFLVAWSQGDFRATISEDGDGQGIFARRNNFAWGAIGGEFQVNTRTEHDQTTPAVAVGRDGRAAVAWTSLYITSTGDGDLREISEVNVQWLAPSHCVPGAHTLCLQDGRYRVEIDWRAFDGNRGRARAAAPLTRDTGYFWFFDPDNVEVIVKILDGRAINDHYWVFYGALSNVEYDVRVTDTMTGETWTSHNPPRRFASVADIEAIPGDDLERVAGSGYIPPSVSPPSPSSPNVASCMPAAETLCLGDGRFEVTVAWRDFGDQIGVGTAATLTEDTGYFWFFADFNIELVVKILDGRERNGFFWVFYGALSNVEYTVRVRDTVTGETWERFNPLGESGSVGDVRALPGI